MGLEIIKEVYRKKTEDMEKMRTSVLKDVFDALKKLRKEVFFEEAYIFGSLSKPNQFGRFSDIDIAFKRLDEDKLFFTAGFLTRELNRDVNVTPLEKLHFKNKITREAIRWKKG